MMLTIPEVAGWAGDATLWNGTIPTVLIQKEDNANTYAYAINNVGQIAGTDNSGSTGKRQEAFLWKGGAVTYLGIADGRGINDAGQVAGNNYDSHATLWDGSPDTDLGTLGGSFSGANAINNVGQVAGYSSIAGNTATHATLWSGTGATDLGTLGGMNSGANDINDKGRIVGTADTTDGASHATIWNGTTATDLGTLGDANSRANAINNVGQVVGDAGGHAVLWDGTTLTDLNSFLDGSTVSTGLMLVSALGINDQGWIVGYSQKEGVEGVNAFLLTPIPEPGTYAMFLTGLGILGFMANRRRALLTLGLPRLCRNPKLTPCYWLGLIGFIARRKKIGALNWGQQPLS